MSDKHLNALNICSFIVHRCYILSKYDRDKVPIDISAFLHKEITSLPK